MGRAVSVRARLDSLFKVVAVFVAAFILLFSKATPSTAWAQESFSPTAQQSSLPDAPMPQITEKSDSQQTGTGRITGTVLDTNQGVIQGCC